MMRTSDGILKVKRACKRPAIFVQLTAVACHLHRGWMMRVDLCSGAFGQALHAAGIDGIAQFFGRLEEGHALGGDIDAFAGLGIAADAGVALAGTEAAKAANFDLVAGFEGADDRLEERVNDDLPIPAGEVSQGGYAVYQIGLGHRRLSLLKLWLS